MKTQENKAGKNLGHIKLVSLATMAKITGQMLRKKLSILTKHKCIGMKVKF